MSISNLGLSEFLLNVSLTDAGVHSFTVASFSGTVQVSASEVVSVFLSNGTSTLDGALGTDFVLGAKGVVNVAIQGPAGAVVALKKLSTSSSNDSSAAASPSWLNNNVYFSGGSTSGSLTETTQSNDAQAVIQRFNYATKTVSRTSGVLPEARILSGGFTDSGVAGYTVGGYLSSTAKNTIYKMAFPSETVTTSANNWTGNQWMIPTISNSGTAGYAKTEQDAVATAIRKLLFSTDTASTIGAVTGSREHMSAFSHKTLGWGYFFGGFDDTNYQNTTYQLTFSTETVTTMANGVLTARFYGMTGASNDGVAGYTVNGQISTPEYINLIRVYRESTQTGSYLLTARTYYSTRNTNMGSVSGVGMVTQGGSDGTLRSNSLTMDYATETISTLVWSADYYQSSCSYTNQGSSL